MLFWIYKRALEDNYNVMSGQGGPGVFGVGLFVVRLFACNNSDIPTLWPFFFLEKTNVMGKVTLKFEGFKE